MKMTITLTLSKRELRLVRDSFPYCNNEDLAAQLGVSESTLHRIARSLGLKKDKGYDKWIRLRSGQRSVETKRERGTMTPKGTVIPHSEEFRFRQGESLKEKIGEEKFAALRRTSNARRNDTIRRDRLRRQYGLAPLTKIRNLGNKMSKKIVCWRHSARKRGYILKDQRTCEREKTVYYNDLTRRTALFERNGERLGFSILPEGAEAAQAKTIARVDGMKCISFE